MHFVVLGASRQAVRRTLTAGAVRFAHSVADSSQRITLPIIPELYDPFFLDKLLPENIPGLAGSGNEAVPSNAMMSALRKHGNRTLTENEAPAYKSTSSPTLDAFSQLGPWSNGEDLESLLGNAWSEDPGLTLKIIWNLRSIHDGKSAKEAFYRAFGWLYEHHPRTAISNLEELVRGACTPSGSSSSVEKAGKSHGYWKDLLNILAIANLNQFSEFPSPHFLRSNYIQPLDRHAPDYTTALQARRDYMSSKRASDNEDACQRLVENIRTPRFRALYIAVARLFADQLAKDLRLSHRVNTMPAGPERFQQLKQLSLAAKWAPTPSCSHDRASCISTAITLLLHHSRHTFEPSFRFPSSVPAEADPEAKAEMIPLRSFYQRHILTPLRNITHIPESFMSSNRWSSIKYTRVPSACMKNNAESFYKHDKDRFEQYITSVEEKKKTITGSTLLPHELVRQDLELLSYSKPSGEKAVHVLYQRALRAEMAQSQRRVVKAQWDTLISSLRESGSLDNSLAVCDVSGSMGSLSYSKRGSTVYPILPAVSLSLVLSQLAKPPFNNSFITFSAQPQLVQLDPHLGIAENVEKMGASDWGMNTNFLSVFLDLILPLAKLHNVPKDQMIKRLFVFSDMQFDAAAASGTEHTYDENGKYTIRILPGPEWETSHDRVEKAFGEAGYDVPEVVYWNLAGYGTMETNNPERKGVAMMSGFSPAMLRVFMGEEDESMVLSEKKKKAKMTPLEMMQKALGKASYSGLKVVD